ncbi:MAG: O-methyltransferase [Phototrophicaceae bacterium]|jgi:predicted O-methyltransferase YrrM
MSDTSTDLSKGAFVPPELSPQQAAYAQAISAQLRPRLPLPQMGGYAISPDFGRLLLTHVAAHPPQRILELGGGTSTLILGYALAQQGSGQIISVDHDPQFAAQTRQRVQEHALSEYVQVQVAPLTPVTLHGQAWQWYDAALIPQTSPFDLIIIDGPPQYANPQPLVRYPALPLLWDSIQTGGYILLDDANRPDEQQIVARWLAEFALDLVAHHEALEKGATLLRKR